MNKFKKGDKVKIPKTKHGDSNGYNWSNFKDDLKDYKLDYLIVEKYQEVYDKNNIGLFRGDDGNLSYNSFCESDLELYETPTFKFNIGDTVYFNGKGRESHRHDDSQNIKSTVYHANNKIVDRISSSYNWYKTEKYGNWITEEGLELVKEKAWIPKIGEWAFILGINHTKENENFPKDKVFKISDVKHDKRDKYFIYVDKQDNPHNIKGTCTGTDSCRKATPNEIPTSPEIKLEKGKYYYIKTANSNNYWIEFSNLKHNQIWASAWRDSDINWCESNTNICDLEGAKIIEISEQEAKNQPIMKEENLIGRYIKLLIDNPECMGCKKGDILIINENNKLEDKELCTWEYSKQLIGKYYELMPVGFSPNKEEIPVFNVGDWVVKKEGYSNTPGIGNSKYGGGGFKNVPNVFKIERKDPHVGSYQDTHGKWCYWYKEHGVYGNALRLAKPHEIPKENVKENLLEEAKRRFPVGTIFNNKNIIPHTGSTKKVSDGKPYFKNVNGEKTSKSTDRIGICDSDGNMTIYKDGKWAEIVEESPKEVKKVVDEFHKTGWTRYTDTIEYEFKGKLPIQGNTLPSKPTLIPIKIRRNKEVLQTVVKRKRLTVIKPKKVLLNQTIKF